MLETTIIGGGLCGLALATHLHKAGMPFRLYEARQRLGGRILTEVSAAGAALDLGPTWYWPNIHPRMVRLIAELGLSTFPQHDSGESFALREADGKLQSLGTDSVHSGAMRVAGGMGALVEALAAHLPAESLVLGQTLRSVKDNGSHLTLEFQTPEGTLKVDTRQLVLALPPRIVEERISFDPPLASELAESLRAAPTWMAGEAKALTAFSQPFWRKAGQSGNGFARHEQAVLGELYDACDADGQLAAIGGFAAMSAEQREAFRHGMPILISSQLVQFFGNEAEQGELHYHDWATEPLTCGTLDRERPNEHPDYADSVLRGAYWNGKLLFGGSETAVYGGGYLEGALEAAMRLQSQILPNPVIQANRAVIDQFAASVEVRRNVAMDLYKESLHVLLSQQKREALTQLALLATVDKVYEDSLNELTSLGLDISGVAVEKGRSELTPWLLAPFNGFNDALLAAVIDFNHGSCALSNFPAEHDLTAEYLQTIRRDLAAAWRQFALGVNLSVLPVEANAA